MAGETLGVIGTGRMGGPMAGRLMDAGYSLVIYDTQSEAMQPLLKRGAQQAKSPADVASRAEIVLASLPTPDIVRAVALGEDGVIQGTTVKTFIDLSTTGPRVAAMVAAGLAARGIVAVDAPVSGGVLGAKNGTLAVMASGPRAALDALQPVFTCFGKPFFVGEAPGLGQTMKLVNN